MAQDERRRDALALLSLFVLIAAPFVERALTGATALSGPLTHDVGFQWVPFHEFIRRALAAGVLPLWSPEIFAGFPFAAFSHTSVWYPPGWLLLAGSYAKLVNLYYPLHLCAAAAGVFCLCRSLRLARPAAFAAAASYVFTGKPFHFIHFLPATQSNTWMPWLILGALLLARGRARGVAMAAAALALAILGGDVESTAYGLVFSAVLLLILARDEALPRRRLLLAAAPLLLGGLIAAVQLVPLIELSRWFVRNQGETFAYFTQRQLPAAIGYSLFAPVRVIGGFELDAPYFYLGAAALGLALAAALGRARPGSRPLFLLTSFVFAFAFGSISFIDRLQYAIPGLNRFGSPEQSLFVGQLFLALLAGQGLDALGRSRRAAAIAGVTLTAFAVVEALLGGRDGLAPGGVIGCAATAVVGVALCVIFRDGWRGDAATEVAATGVAATDEKNKEGDKKIVGDKNVAPPRLAALAVAAVLVLDVWLLAALNLPNNRPSTYNVPDWLKELAEYHQPANGRVATVTRLGLSDPELLHHVGMRLGFDQFDSWITTPIRSYAELLALADPRVARFQDGKLDYMGLNGDPRDGRFIDAPGMPILDLIGLRYIINRGVPIKFSSPAMLNLVRPEYRRRELTGGLAETILHDDAILSAANEVIRLRLFIAFGDRLRFDAAAFHRAGQAPSALEMRVYVQPVGGDSVEIFQRSVPTSPAEPGQPNMELLGMLIPTDLDLGSIAGVAGHEVILSFITSGPPGRGDLAGVWFRASLVNPNRPLQHSGRVYENRDALPRAFVARDFAVVAPGDDLKLIKTMPAAELRRKLLLARAPMDLAPVPGAGPGKPGMLLDRRPGDETWLVTAPWLPKAPQLGLLFVSDQYYPGWHALVEGREEPILRADHAFRAVRVEPGDGVVRFVYRPVSVRLGLWATAAGLLSLLVFIGVRRWTDRAEKIFAER